MKKLMAVALATVMTQQAMAANWVQTADNTKGTGYIDLDSVRPDYLIDGTPVMTTWTQLKYKQAQDLGDGKKYWSIKSFEYFDCYARKSDSEYIVAYNKQGRVIWSGNMSSFSRYSSANWDRVIPDSAGETWLDTVCAYAN